MYPYIQSRFYRSIEVLLGLPYDHAIDMWSLGCILYELHCGDPLFNGTSELDQVMKITEVLGFPPEPMLRKGRKTTTYFRRNTLNNNYERVSTKKIYMPPAKRKLADLLGNSTGGPRGRRKGEPGHKKEDYDIFEDLLRRLLDLDPKTRMTPREMAEHPFLNKGGSVFKLTNTASGLAAPGSRGADDKTPEQQAADAADARRRLNPGGDAASMQVDPPVAKAAGGSFAPTASSRTIPWSLRSVAGGRASV